MDWSTTIASALKCSGSNESNVCDMTCRSHGEKAGQEDALAEPVVCMCKCSSCPHWFFEVAT